MFGKFGKRHRDHDGGCREGGHRFAHGPFGRHGLFGGHRGGRGHRGFGQRRLFEQGDLRFVILHLLAEKPRHGYEIIKALEDRFGGMYSPSPGVIYPTLTLLEELGYAQVAAPEESGKKLYTVTDAGRAFLAENKATVDAVMGRFEEASRAYGGGPAPEVKRAVHNLQMALSVRLGKGPMTEEQVRQVAAILDQAAQSIERA